MIKKFAIAGFAFMLVASSVMAATVNGKVTDRSTGRGIAAASVVLGTYQSGSTTPTPVDTMLTDTSGNYSFTNISGGTYSLIAAKTGYMPNGVQLFYVSRNQTVTQNIQLTSIASGSGTISGTVTNVANVAIKDAEVIIGFVANDQSVSVDTVTTSDGGKFVASALAPSGNYVVTVSATGYITASRSSIRVRSGDTTTLTFKLQAEPAANAGIVGKATDSASGEAMGGVLIALRRDTSVATTIWVPVDSATTKNDGSYSFADLKPSTIRTPYSIIASKAGYRTVTLSNIIVGDSTVDTVNIVLAPITKGSMFIFVGKDGSDSALAGASVSAAAVGGDAIFTGTTNSAGWISFANVVTGSYTVTATMPGYITESATRRVDTNEKDTTNILLAAGTSNAKTVSGIVRKADGSPVAKAAVIVKVTQQGVVRIFFDSTNTTGDYEISGIPSGITSATLTVEATGFQLYSATVALTQTTTNHNVTLVPASGVIIAEVMSGISEKISLSGHLTIVVNNVRTPGSLTLYNINGALLHKADLSAGNNTIALPRINAGKTVVAVVRQDGRTAAHTLLVR